MGLHFSRLWERMFGKKEMRILMVGLDAAGKVGGLFFGRKFINSALFHNPDNYLVQTEAW